MKLGAKFIAAAAFLGLFFLSARQPARALEFREGNDINVSSPDIVRGSLVIVGSNLTISSTIDGDLICAGKNIHITGDVYGDVICAGQTIVVDGDVDGSVRTASQTMSLNGSVGRNVTLVAQQLLQGAGSVIDGELSGWTQSTTIDGMVNEGVWGGSRSLLVNGEVNHGVNVDVANLTLGGTASVSGGIHYRSGTQAVITPGASVSGEVSRRDLTKPNTKISPVRRVASRNWVNRLLTALVVNLVVGAILVSAFPGFIRSLVTTMNEGGASLLIKGFVAVIVVPVALILLALTIIGIPVALIGGILWILILSLVRIPVAVAVGMTIMQKVVSDTESLLIPMLLGVVILWSIFQLPIIGGIVSFAAMCFGVGAVIRRIRS